MAKIYSDDVLEEAPERATKFLSGVGAEPTVRTLLAQAGMNDADLIEGRTLLLATIAAPLPRTEKTDTDTAKAQRDAEAELDAWDEPNFPRLEAALVRKFPDAAEYVFDKLHASTGAAAVKGVATLLSRVDALESGSDPNRSKSRKADKDAVKLLAERKFTKQERERLHALVQVALGPTETLAEAPTDADDPRTARRASLVELKQWYDEWATAAKSVVKKRAHLIRMGLASRKSPKKQKPEPPAPPAPADPASGGATTPV